MISKLKNCGKYPLIVILFAYYQNKMPISYQKKHMNTGISTADKYVSSLDKRRKEKNDLS